MLHALYEKYTKHVKISHAEPPFTVKTIDWVQQTGLRKHSILLSITHTLYVNKVCHGVGRCVKDGSSNSNSNSNLLNNKGLKATDMLLKQND